MDDYMYQDVDIVIVQKKTDDHAHQKTREILLNCLEGLGFTYAILTLDDIRSQEVKYFDPSQKHSGFFPRKKIVISLGGDGTLLHASHHIGNHIRLIGINASPFHSIGHMCILKPNEINDKLPSLIADENNFKNIQRLQLSILNNEQGQKKSQTIFPLCLNDVLICHQHPAATTRVSLTLIDLKSGEINLSHSVFSSGIWVSTVMGQTGGISSYGFSPAHKEDDMIFVAIREPYLPQNAKKYVNTFSYANADKKLSILSNMSAGILCIDGYDTSIEFGLGDTVSFDAPAQGILRLVL